MLRTTLKTLHFVGLAAFLGSILGHILLAQAADPLAEPSLYAVLAEAKHTSTLWLTIPGLSLAMASGVALLATQPGLVRAPWLAIKAALALLIAGNGLLVLSPLGKEIIEAAANGGPAIAELVRREGLFGALNLTLVLALIVLSVARPRFGRAHGAEA